MCFKNGTKTGLSECVRREVSCSLKPTPWGTAFRERRALTLIVKELLSNFVTRRFYRLLMVPLSVFWRTSSQINFFDIYMYLNMVSAIFVYYSLEVFSRQVFRLNSCKHFSSSHAWYTSALLLLVIWTFEEYFVKIYTTKLLIREVFPLSCFLLCIKYKQSLHPIFTHCSSLQVRT